MIIYNKKKIDKFEKVKKFDHQLIKLLRYENQMIIKYSNNDQYKLIIKIIIKQKQY